MFGKAVVADINNYYRNQAYIDLNNLPEDAEATQSVVQATLTEGAIGYRKFKVISGQKAMAVLRLRDGSYPPFGAEVKMTSSSRLALWMMKAMSIWRGQCGRAYDGVLGRQRTMRDRIAEAATCRFVQRPVVAV